MHQFEDKEDLIKELHEAADLLTKLATQISNDERINVEPMSRIERTISRLDYIKRQFAKPS